MVNQTNPKSEYLGKCTHLKEMLELERNEFSKAIEENKYYLSEKKGADVGKELAISDFKAQHFLDWAREFKENYCRNVCPKGIYCNLNKDSGKKFKN